MNLLELETKITNRHGTLQLISDVHTCADTTLYEFSDEIARYLKGKYLVKFSNSTKDYWFNSLSEARHFFGIKDRLADDDGYDMALDMTLHGVFLSEVIK